MSKLTFLSAKFWISFWFYFLGVMVLGCVPVALLGGFRVAGYYLAAILLFLFILQICSSELRFRFAARRFIIDGAMIFIAISIITFLAYNAPE